MAWTKHGYQIPRTPVEENEKPSIFSLVNCGGVERCVPCALEVVNVWADLNFVQRSDVRIVTKAYEALKKIGLSDNQVCAGLQALLDAGIVFRERT